jgi:glycine hydroxymethyltransferase
VLGLVAGKQFHDPLKEGAVIMTGSTHKTFFGTQRGLVCSNQDEQDWLAVEKGTFPGSTSNHHLDTLAVLAIAVYEFMEYGQAYAAQVVKNARALGKALDKKGFSVECKEFGYTQSHQIAVNVKEQGGGKEAANILENNNIICNFNLLPSDPLGKVTNPSGLRLGTQEMTRFGMKEKEMETVAEFFKRCLMDDEYVGDDVKEFRKKFQVVQYSFDLDYLKGLEHAKGGRKKS